jgi:FKBP-type peptidyl-prolyl cis-trans isomerase
MKRAVIIFFGAILIGLITSCLKIDDTKVPTWEEEQIQLKNYINKIISEGNDVDTTALGVYYVTLDEGTGDYPEDGDTLKVGYAGYLNNGVLFDTSVWNDSADSTYTFVLGEQDMIKGWDDGMKVINKDARVQLIIPSDLAYGSTGRGSIPPYQTLIFVVIMKEIKPLK